MCVHAEYNHDFFENSLWPCSGYAELCLLGIILTLRERIESQLFTKFGFSSRFFSISYGSMPISAIGSAL